LASSVCVFAPPLHADHVTEPSTLQVALWVPALQVPHVLAAGGVHWHLPP